MRRLYSTFAGGWPGIGLLLLRLVLGSVLVVRAGTSLWDSPFTNTTIASALLAGAGILLIAGLWTPAAGVLVTLLEIWKVFTTSGETSGYLLPAAMASSLVMLGPGLWSVDARLFGWKRVEVSLPER